MADPSTTDPLFSGAPDAGEVRRGEHAAIHGYYWKKADGTTCDLCQEPIQGRAFAVAPIRYIPVGASTRKLWRHVKCVSAGEWAEWMGPPSSSPRRPFTTRPAPKYSSRAAAVAAAQTA